MASSQWEPQSEARQQAWREFLPRWLANHPGCTVGVYAGFDIDPNPKDVSFRDHRAPNSAKLEDVRDMKRLATPWLDIGMTEIWWDTAGKPDRRRHAMAIAQNLRELGMQAGGEAMPRDFSSPGKRELDREAVHAMPWMALVPYFRQWDKNHSWRGDPNETELFIGLRGGDKPTDAEMRSAFERGFVPWVYSPTLSERALRIWGRIGK